MKIKALFLAAAAVLAVQAPAQASTYAIDTEGQHAFIQFKASHLGYSWLLGRFNTFSGEFSYDEQNPSAAKVAVDIDVNSIDSNHAKRDKHLRSADFFDADQFPKAKFVSTGFQEKGNGKAVLSGDLTIKGITKKVDIAVNHIGAGNDPWGGYRRGFEGSTTITLGDFNLNPKGWPAEMPIELYLSIEGVRK